MYEFYYKYNKSEHNANLLFSDTDSLVYEIEANDVNEHQNLFDFSDYSEDSKFFDLVK